MKFLSNTRAKYVAAAFTALAAIVIPAQATDCNTICTNAAQQAGADAGSRAMADWQAQCAYQYAGTPQYGSCMNWSGYVYSNAYNQAYNQTYSQCSGSCH